MKYLQLFENWNPLSKSDIEAVRDLNSIGVVSDKELRDLKHRMGIEQMILNYDPNGYNGFNGTGNLYLRNST